MTSWPTDVIRRLSQLDAVTSQWRGLTLVLSWTGARLDSAMTSHARMNGGSVAAVSPPSGNTDNYSHSQVLHDFVPHSWFKFHFISLFMRRSHQMQKNLYCPSTKYLMSSVTDSLCHAVTFATTRYQHNATASTTSLALRFNVIGDSIRT